LENFFVDNAERYCLITGAAGGIGQALVRGFQAAGYHVIGLDYLAKPENLECSYWLEMDLSHLAQDPACSDLLVSRISAITGNQGLGVLVNNAALQVLGGVGQLSREDWRRTLDVNLLAPFFLVQALLAVLMRGSGCVINIGSIHSQLTKKGFVAYASSKAALAGLTRSMAVDIGGIVRVNAIEPAAIETRMLQEGFDNDAAKLQALKFCHPTLSIGMPEEIARLAVVIAGQDLKFLNGSLIGIDGGVRSVLHDPGGD